MRGIAQVFAHRKLAYLLREPKVPAQRKETAIRQALANKVLPTSLNLALLVVQRELVDLMSNIARELEQFVLDYKNEAIADVTTATRIDDAQLTQIKQALEKRTGKTIITRARVQPDILGGVIARVGDQVIDGSVRSHLAALRQQLLKSALSSGINLPFEVGSESQATAADGAKRSPQQDTVESSKIQ